VSISLKRLLLAVGFARVALGRSDGCMSTCHTLVLTGAGDMLRRSVIEHGSERAIGYHLLVDVSIQWAYSGFLVSVVRCADMAAMHWHLAYITI
jgi:hypothetical protein